MARQLDSNAIDRIVDNLDTFDKISSAYEIFKKKFNDSSISSEELVVKKAIEDANNQKNLTQAGIRQNVFNATRFTSNEPTSYITIPPNTDELKTDWDDDIVPNSGYQGKRFDTTADVYMVNFNPSNVIFKGDKEEYEAVYIDPNTNEPNTRSPQKIGNEWSATFEIKGSKGSECELKGVHIRYIPIPNTRTSTIYEYLRSSGFINSTGAVTIDIPGKIYDPTLKRLVHYPEDLDLAMKQACGLAALIFGTGIRGSYEAVRNGQEIQGLVNAGFDAIAKAVLTANYTQSNGSLLTTLSKTVINKRSDYSLTLYMMNLLNKIIADGKDLITRFYAWAEDRIRKNGYKFKRHGNSGGKIKAPTGAWYESYDPYKSKAYRELGLTHPRKTSKGVTPYPTFKKINVISYVNTSPEALNMLYADQVLRYYTNKSSLKDWQSYATEIKTTMSKNGYYDLKEIYGMMAGHWKTVESLRAGQPPKLVSWIAERNIQLPILILTHNDLYAMKAASEPKFVPLGYRSILSLQEILFHSPTYQGIAPLPVEYYQSVYQFKANENLDTERYAKDIVQNLLKYVKGITNDTTITVGVANDNRRHYNAQKTLPSFNADPPMAVRGISRIPQRIQPAGGGSGNGNKTTNGPVND